MSAAARMRRFRKAKPELAKAIDARRADARRRAEEAARAYVAAYLRRGRIAPPMTCDHCGDYSEHLRPWHPDPAQRRQVAWLCPEHRRSIPALALPVILHWEWPGLNVSPTRPRWPHFALDPKAIEAGLAAVRRAEVRGQSRTPADRSRAFTDGFLSFLGGEQKTALLAHGLRGDATWAPFGDESIDAHLRAWIARERHRRERERRLAPAIEVLELAPVYEPRLRRPRHDRKVVTVIPPPQKPREVRVALDLDALDSLIANANAIADATNARVQANLEY